MKAKDLLLDGSNEVLCFASDKAGEDPVLFKEMVRLAADNMPKYSIRAVRVVYQIILETPVKIQPYLKGILHSYVTTSDERVKLEWLKVFALAVDFLDENDRILMARICFQEMDRRQENEKLKIHSMEVLYLLSVKEEDIKSELFWSINEQIYLSSQAFKERGKNILNRLFPAGGAQLIF